MGAAPENEESVQILVKYRWMYNEAVAWVAASISLCGIVQNLLTHIRTAERQCGNAPVQDGYRG